MTREITTKLIEFAEETGPGTWEAIARECLSYMSEADVADMNRVAEFVSRDEDDEEHEHWYETVPSGSGVQCVAPGHEEEASS